MSGYDREMTATNKIRRFVTPTWENSNDWTDPLLSYTIGEVRSPEVESPAQDYLDFDTSPAYPDTLFIGANTGGTESSYGVMSGQTWDDGYDFALRGVRDLVMWEYLWANPLEAVAPGGPPALPGANATKIILGRWREPQLPWSSPRNFVPRQLAYGSTSAHAAYSSASYDHMLGPNPAVIAIHSWDAPTVFGAAVRGAPSASRAAFTVATYLW